MFIAGFIGGFLFYRNYFSSLDRENISETRLKGYKFISPLLECNNEESDDKEIRPFKAELEKFLSEQKSQNNISQASIYFRDLNNGPWIGLNEKEEFSPASMLKVPLMMAALKKAENNPKILTQKIKIESVDNTDQIIKPSSIVKNGESYTLDELIYRMLVFSDNGAQSAIFKFIGNEATAQAYSDLNLAVPQADKQENFMTVKNYASFFRTLFNASYLNKDISERALELLTKTEYRKGLVAGVPNDVAVAHKFGERMNENEKQLHDCGIIYYSKHPYLLCIMSRGQNYQQMENFIKGISGFVYKKVSENF